MQILTEKTSHLLFIGDSITDCSRKTVINPLGDGFVATIAKQLKKTIPKLKISNRGVSGNTSADLAARWQHDCIDLKPSVVSILIGINDTWRRYGDGIETDLSTFEQYYRDILDRTVTILDTSFILCEPFLLPLSDDQKLWHVDLNPKRRLIRGLANEYNAHFVPLHKAFQEMATTTDAEQLTEDGVHPTQKGHTLIADTWLKTVVG